jgi:hypothetical protein
MAKVNIQEQAQEIIRIAEAKGVQTNFFFTTTFKRYLRQIKTLENLEKVIDEEGVLVKKEYVKNRKNLYESPAIRAYNSTTDSANKTVATSIKIIRGFNKTDDDIGEEDPLLKIINGSDEDETDN